MNPLPYRIGEPPERLRKARLDNIALVPASLLSSKDTYQGVANRLPKGSILLVASASPRQKRILDSVASFLRTHSHQVITLPVERFKTIKVQMNTTRFPEVHEIAFIRFQPDYYASVVKKQKSIIRNVEKKLPGTTLRWSGTLVSPETQTELLEEERINIDGGVELTIHISEMKYPVTEVLETLDEEIAKLEKQPYMSEHDKVREEILRKMA